MMRILIADCYADEELDESVGGPGRWFREAFGGDAERFVVWRALSESEPPRGPFDGIAIGGSPAAAFDREPWIERVADFVRRTAEAGTPMLGVCFGQQIVARALGGRVERNPAGREYGTLPVYLNDAGGSDPLFAGAPEVFPCMLTHTDVVTELPRGAECLAHSPLTECQAFRVGEKIRCVQFHPEFTVEIVKSQIERIREELSGENFDIDELRASLRDTPEAGSVLANFEKYFIPLVSKIIPRKPPNGGDSE